MKSNLLAPELPLAPSPRLAWKYASLVVAMVLTLVWSAVWMLNLGIDVGVAVSVAAVCVGMAIAAVQSGRIDLGKGRDSSLRMPPAPAPDVPESPAAGVHLDDKHWSLDVFAKIDARRFAAVCEAWFAWAGFDTRSKSHRTDEGVDIWLHAARLPGPVAIVRCKHWNNKPVGLPEMKDFLGLVAAHQSVHGTYTTTSTYTPEALQFAQEHGIDAVDGPGLLRRIQTRTRQSQRALLAVAYGHTG